MKRLEINNEVVSLRQSVRQARICVINKLIREAKRLRTSHGNEKQLERNKSKADKLLREVFALKRTKDDEISKFAIVNFENLSSILQKPHTSDETRAMAKIARYKSLSSRIVEFREKYPDYEEYICWRKKQLSPKKKERNSVTFQEEHSKPLHNHINNRKENKVISTARTSCEENGKTNERCNKLEETSSDRIRDKESEDSDRGKKMQDVEEQSGNSRASEAVTKIISSQATVKRFTEILQETELKGQNERYDGSKSKKSMSGRPESTINGDDFFVHATNAAFCSSIPLLPKETNTSSTSSVSDNTYTSSRIEEKKGRKGKLCTEGICRERRDFRRRNVNDKNNYEGYGGKKATSIQRWKDEEKRGGRSTNVKDESLHPSWAAKKKQQDIMKQGFQGKKVKFDED